MDAEVWSHADIRNGRRLFPVLALLVVLKEGAVVCALLQHLPWAAQLAPAGNVPHGWPAPVQSAFAFALSLLLLVLAYVGRGWALLGLGLIYVASCAYALWLLAPQLSPALTAAPDWALWAALGNGVLGLALGAVFVFSPPLKAFTWSQANARLVIPLPDDDAPPRRAWRRQRTLGESLVAVVQGLGNGLLILLVVAVGAYIYGFGDDILAFLRRL